MISTYMIIITHCRDQSQLTAHVNALAGMYVRAAQLGPASMR